MNKTIKIIAMAAFWTFFSNALAEELLVPTQHSTIQSAINASFDNDTIIVAPGTYTDLGNRDIDFLGKAITVRSTDPEDPCVVVATIIDCNGTVSDHHRGFYFHSGEDANSVLAGLTITSGRIGDGGAIRCDGSSPTVTKCTFSGNSALSMGGGMASDNNSNPTVTNCTFSANWAGNGGGGMANLNNSSPTITNCIFRENRHEWPVTGGGGMVNANSDPTITNCTFSGNSTTYFGGGMWNVNHSKPTVTNCTFSGNVAGYYGGGMYNTSNSDPTLTNCILWGNTALDASQIYNKDDESSVIVTFSDVQGGWSGEGNIDADPCFVEHGYWADANDPNIIVEPNDPNAVWVNGDYHLKSAGWRWDTERNRWTYDDVTSRCIDAGNPGSPLADEPISIPDDPNNEWGQNLRINMGAFGGTDEASVPPYDWALLSDVTNDGISDIRDLDIPSSLWLNLDEQLYADFNRDGIIEISDFALLAQDWLEQTSWH